MGVVYQAVRVVCMQANSKKRKGTIDQKFFDLVKIVFSFFRMFPQLNRFLFPHFYIVTNVLLFMELVTYRGFIAKYVFIDPRILVIISVMSLLYVFFENIKKTVPLSKQIEYVFELNKLLLAPLFISYYLLISIEDYYYPNYLYSNFHINALNFVLILSFNVSIAILQLLSHSKFLMKYLQEIIESKAVVHMAFFIAVLSFVLPQSQTISTWMYQASIRVARSFNYTWEERLIYLSGGEQNAGWIVLYTKFINTYVADDGVIFIPPQKESWQMEGNEYYMRWFIYPRRTVQSQDISAEIPNEATYVLIDNGAWPGMKEYGWPRHYIAKEKIEFMAFIDKNTHEEVTVRDQDYDPKTMSYKWGVIKLKGK